MRISISSERLSRSRSCIKPEQKKNGERWNYSWDYDKCIGFMLRTKENCGSLSASIIKKNILNEMFSATKSDYSSLTIVLIINYGTFSPIQKFHDVKKSRVKDLLWWMNVDWCFKFLFDFEVRQYMGNVYHRRIVAVQIEWIWKKTSQHEDEDKLNISNRWRRTSQSVYI